MKILTMLTNYALAIWGLSLFNACDGNNSNKTTDKIGSEIIQETKSAFPKINFEISPDNKHDFKIGETISVNLKQNDTLSFDSIQIYFENRLLRTESALPAPLKLNKENNKPGKSELKLKIFRNKESEEQVETFRYLSDIEPKKYSYQVINVYPHERSAYTQGLVYEDDYFYESNGIKGESTLRKVQIGTGDPIESFTLSPEIFAEGLTIMGNKIYQLSWQNHVGFVYDKKSFKLLNNFSYNTEGWGLTNDGKNLIMSDGTEIIYYLDPISFTEVNHIEVYDNKGPVESLNELELIDGEIWANIYRTDKIARIDPKTGKVLSYIDLSKILNAKDYDQNTDVLNGIAYDIKTKRLFVTGKKWPKLFEIKLK